MQFQVMLTQDENWWIARNVDLWVVSQGESFDEALANIKEASELYLEGTPTLERAKLVKPRQTVFTSILV